MYETTKVSVLPINRHITVFTKVFFTIFLTT